MPSLIPELATAGEIAAEIGFLIQATRVSRGLLVEDLAVRAGLTAENIEKLEMGEASLATMLAVGKAFGVASIIVNAFVPKPTSLDEIERLENGHKQAGVSPWACSPYPAPNPAGRA